MSADRGVSGAPERARPDQDEFDLAVVNVRPIVEPSSDGGSDDRWGGVAVRDGRIARLLAPGEQPPARQVIDGGGHWLLPGLIDSHVHFRTPGLTHKEDWEHGSRAAVAGGVTTVIDMPNTRPPFHDPADASRRAALVAGRSLVDFRFHLGVDPARPRRIADATPAEATSAKAFLTGHQTAPDVLRDPARLAETFGWAARAGLRLCLHAEDDGVLGLLGRAHGTPAGYLQDERSRPRSGAIVAVARIIELAARHRTAAHVLHVSCAEEVDLLVAAHDAGVPVTFEVTGHHLSFSAADAARQGTLVRLSPSPRRADDQDALWEAVLRGRVAAIGSDHAPHTLAEKRRPLAEAPPGLPGTQELLPAVLTGMRRREPTTPIESHLRRVAELLAARPADLFGLAARKGRLRPGLDADLTLLDVDTAWTLGADQVQAKCGWSAYAGWPMIGRVLATALRGRLVYDARGARGAPWFGRPAGEFLDAQTPAGLV